MSLLDDCYVSFLNLEKRTDKKMHMEAELARVGIYATRTRGKLPHEFNLKDTKYRVQVNRTPGSIGCWAGMVEIAETALKLDKHAMIFEDDLLFCDDVHERFKIIEEFDKDFFWDVIWLGGTVHINPPYWHTGRNPDLLTPSVGLDCLYVGQKYLYRSFGSFSTHAWILNKNSIRKVVDMLDDFQHLSMGIDHAHINLSRKLDNYVFLPGCIIQKDGRSDIGNGDTIFSSFKSLGDHWFAKNLKDFNHDTYQWGEVKQKL